MCNRCSQSTLRKMRERTVSSKIKTEFVSSLKIEQQQKKLDFKSKSPEETMTVPTLAQANASTNEYQGNVDPKKEKEPCLRRPNEMKTEKTGYLSDSKQNPDSDTLLQSNDSDLQTKSQSILKKFKYVGLDNKISHTPIVSKEPVHLPKPPKPLTPSKVVRVKCSKHQFVDSDDDDDDEMFNAADVLEKSLTEETKSPNKRNRSSSVELNVIKKPKQSKISKNVRI